MSEVLIDFAALHAAFRAQRAMRQQGERVLIDAAAPPEVLAFLCTELAQRTVHLRTHVDRLLPSVQAYCIAQVEDGPAQCWQAHHWAARYLHAFEHLRKQTALLRDALAAVYAESHPQSDVDEEPAP